MLIDCKSLAKKIEEETVELLKNSKKQAKLVSYALNPDPSTVSYLKSQQKKAQTLGIEYVMKIFDNSQELVENLKKDSQDETVHGIFVAHPLPKDIDELSVVSLINPEKDIEGRNPVNLGRLFFGIEDFAPCTAAAVVEILTSTTSLEGKKAVIVGRSVTVGQPVAVMLLRKDRSATVTVCHTKTKNLVELTKSADIVVVAVGKPYFLTPEMVKEEAVVVDVGINVVEGKVVGDVHPDVEKKAFLTPVPGGVGVVTTSILMYRVARNAFRGG
ncbi:bifunctional 5,10-methylenetetrahydrofolate dehydrogenase/5,10-methenyltetrahydrofolate cyclohydrolase [Pseudothermotoga thermarum]|uniref:Bifunctional protein FolD n=1 Tax=Pseudothermotoga thermarum DSM 5069 TaxID=688269 RepID=F7YU37_9THEM|nr:bifunctional 5,10-methylenetetrahydrofolate dehydrogenase/5,10-methenyltetrahydrofolate cyclohydrolase [Pseudothermotoga thermarum]AEH51626.1 5,10-methylenetetrahydrofolate dehydrogenase (NADP+); methenyltetrahydrofolate cyclohydrolase [Pseudothermotoga thermarum DSM 5069]